MPPFASSYELPPSPRWQADVTPIDVGRGWWATARGILDAGRSAEALILRGYVSLGDGYVDLLAAGVVARRGTPVLVAECTWQPGSRTVDRKLNRRVPEGYQAEGRTGRVASKAMIRAIDGPNVHYSVLSTDEISMFSDFWGVARDRVHATGFRATADEIPGSGPALPLSACSGVFAGGDNLRDYRALMAAAPNIRAEVTIGTRIPLGSAAIGVPGLTAGPLSPEVYADRAAKAAIVVVALQTGTVRSAGQQTYLNAMLQGKPVVVTDAPGVRDYIQQGVTGLIVPPHDPPALARAINGLLDTPAQAAALGEAGRQHVMERYSKERYCADLLNIAEAIRVPGRQHSNDSTSSHW